MEEAGAGADPVRVVGERHLGILGRGLAGDLGQHVPDFFRGRVRRDIVSRPRRAAWARAARLGVDAAEEFGVDLVVEHDQDIARG